MYLIYQIINMQVQQKITTYYYLTDSLRVKFLQSAYLRAMQVGI